MKKKEQNAATDPNLPSTADLFQRRQILTRYKSSDLRLLDCNECGWCHMHIFVCLYYMSVQIEQPAGPSLLAASPALNSSLAIGHNPVVHSLLCQITRMASLHKKKKKKEKAGSLKLLPFNHLPLFSSVLPSSLWPATSMTDCLVEHDVNFIHKGRDQEFDIIRV